MTHNGVFRQDLGTAEPVGDPRGKRQLEDLYNELNGEGEFPTGRWVEAVRGRVLAVNLVGKQSYAPPPLCLERGAEDPEAIEDNVHWRRAGSG